MHNWFTIQEASGSSMALNENQLLILSLTLKVRGPSNLGSTESISWLLMPWLLACDVLVWRNDIRCRYMFMFSLKDLAHKGLTCKSDIKDVSGILIYHTVSWIHNNFCHNTWQLLCYEFCFQLSCTSSVRAPTNFEFRKIIFLYHSLYWNVASLYRTQETLLPWNSHWYHKVMAAVMNAIYEKALTWT